MNLTATAIAILVLQWVNVPLPNTPRMPDGNPNLTAPVPKTPDGKPDLTGIWRNPDGKYLAYIAADGVQVPFQPWAEALYKERQENNSKDRPSGRCLPHGVPDIMLVPATPFKIIQTPGVTVILHENQGHFRQIFTDGRGFPNRQMGGDTLVVDTKGFNGEAWLDLMGKPSTEALHVKEEFHRKDFGHMDIRITIDDPKAYTRSWKVSIPFALFPDNELMESVCENERDFEHLVGK